jgi:lysophospholipase L1-like esterase
MGNQAQIKGDSTLNYDPERGTVKAPLVLWGPYLWADGLKPRKDDKLTWERQDLIPRDGTHPSRSGKEKVARLLLEFFKANPTSRQWFVKETQN